MAAPVWVLSVDLQTKTATFESGMGAAAQAARSSFSEIKAGSEEMGRSVGGHMGDARHGVMMLGEEFGVHLPRGLTTFIASLGPVGAAMEAAFPFIAIILGATLLIEHLAKVHEAAEKAAAAHTEFGTKASEALGGLDDKILHVGMQMDELTGNHLAALYKELQLIDHASLKELISTFDIFAKGADAALAGLKTSWYQFGVGSAGAKHSLDEFKSTYDSLLAQGKDKEALALLDAKVAREREILRLQTQARDNQTVTNEGYAGANPKYEEAILALKKQGVGFDEKEIASQEILVDALNDQVEASQKIATYKKAQEDYAKAKTGKTMGAEDDKKWKELAREAKQEADDAQRAWEEAYKEAVSKLQESEKAKIDATEKASKERLAAIDAAIKEENAKGLQATGYYKSLLLERINITREMAAEEARISAELGKEEASHAQAMADLAIASGQEADMMRLARHYHTEQELANAEIQGEIERYGAQQAAYAKELAALDTHAKEYELKKKQIEDKQVQAEQALQNKITAIDDAAEKKRLAQEQANQRKLQDVFANSSTRILSGQESVAKVMQSLAQSVEQQALSAALRSLMAMETIDGRKKLSKAHASAAEAYEHAGNPFLGAVLAGMAFAQVMALAEGGIVPGVGGRDTVPAMLTPGESVIPKKLTEGLTHAAQHGNMGGGDGDVHIHHSPTYNLHMIDGTGVDKMLQEHSDHFERHVGNVLRKRNK